MRVLDDEGKECDNPFSGKYRTSGKEIIEASRREFISILKNVEDLLSRFSVEQAMRFSDYVKTRRFASGGDVEHMLYKNVRHQDGEKIFKKLIELELKAATAPLANMMNSMKSKQSDHDRMSSGGRSPGLNIGGQKRSLGSM